MSLVKPNIPIVFRNIHSNILILIHMKIFILILLLTLTFGCRHDVIRIKLYHETDLQPEDYTGKVKHE